MDFEKYNDKFLKEYLQFNRHKRLIYRRAKHYRVTDDTETCPECGADTITDMDRCEIYCKECGLVTQATIPYVGLRKVNYKYGLLL